MRWTFVDPSTNPMARGMKFPFVERSLNDSTGAQSRDILRLQYTLTMPIEWLLEMEEGTLANQTKG